MKIILSIFAYFSLFLTFHAQAEYKTKVWLEPKSQQIQVTNEATRSMIIVNLGYDALKTYLYTYEIHRAGPQDPILSAINGPESMQALIPMIDNLEYVTRSHDRFGELTEDFQTYSVYGSYSVPKGKFADERAMDIYFIKRILTKLFAGNNYSSAKEVGSCGGYLTGE